MQIVEPLVAHVGVELEVQLVEPLEVHVGVHLVEPLAAHLGAQLVAHVEVELQEGFLNQGVSSCRYP